jgi:transporter family-2 protein
MKAFLYLFAAGAGALNAVQAGCNAGLAKALGNPFAAALAIVGVSFTSLLTAGVVSGRLAWPDMDRVAGAPWWAWFGGVLGATFVMSQLLVAAQVGAGVYIGLTVTASIIVSLLLDHFGLVGFEVHPAGIGRLMGAALMIAGVALVTRY